MIWAFITYAILLASGHMIAMRHFIKAKSLRWQSVDIQVSDNGPNIITERLDREAFAAERTAGGIWTICGVLAVIGLCHCIMLLLRGDFA